MDNNFNSTSNEALVRTPKISAKDFFLHLGAIVALYVVAGNFISLLFEIINKAYPAVGDYGYFMGGSQISLPVATLIIVFPVFVFLSRLVHQSYLESPAKKDLAVRKWLTYITLFIAGIMLVGDLVTVLYKFLDGQDLTLAFYLKALTVFLVSGLVFGFYLQDIRERVSAKARNWWATVVGLVILVAIVLGFAVIGSPKTQRLIRVDNQKVADLQNLEWQVINYWQTNGEIPDKWEAIMIDQDTGSPYQYKKTGPLDFELCAVFNAAYQYSNNLSVVYPPKGDKQSDWSHGVGLQCFERTIDPVAYPTQVKG